MSFQDDLFNRFHEIHTDLIKAVDGLPAEALDWVPGKEMNSIKVLVVHLTGAEKFWISDVALGEPTNRVRDEEFKARGLAVEELKQRLTAADEYPPTATSSTCCSRTSRCASARRRRATATSTCRRSSARPS